MKLVFIGTNYTKTCEMEMDSGSQPISILIPKVLLTADSKIIHKFEISCDQVLKDIIIAADLNGESIEINSSVQIGFDLSLMISSKHIIFNNLPSIKSAKCGKFGFVLAGILCLIVDKKHFNNYSAPSHNCSGKLFPISYLIPRISYHQ
ncbi:Uncharacterized protein BM_BM337 [Brugia malayi]|uniref:Bm337, isoform a; Bm337, isoform c n=1 Tax=Brugia malayi TaxID=6279 RepID=A0A0K0JA11_BRUMA|nr:Uncharacterized protein BM_BM337 [Brugia malayi]CDP93361.1 Bm337, isoform d [Brugia malayi]VIO89509.1 Uncharacterized protein BM_BM337 [Brugia malayi]